MREEALYPESNLVAVDVNAGDKEKAWQEVKSHCGDSLTQWGIEVLRSGLDGHVGTVLIEPHYVCKDYRNLYSHFYSKKFVPRSQWCFRLHFFRKPGVRDEHAILNATVLAEDYLGFSVVEPVAPCCLGRTIIDPFKIGFHPSSFFCLRTVFRAHVNGAEYQVAGFPYRAQSREATVCAHTALWSVCRYLSERYPLYRELQPYDLIRLTGDSEGRRVPYRGMRYSDYSTILTQFGCHPEFVVPKDNYFKNEKGNIDVDWQRDRESFYDLYSYVESGFPVLASFNGHVAVLVGHTLRDSLPINVKPEFYANGYACYNSSSFVENYVAIDDNLFPYQYLGYKDDASNYGRGFSELKHFPCIDSIHAAVVPLPEKAYLRARDARTLTSKWLKTSEAQQHLKQLQSQVGNQWPKEDPIIIRTFLTSSTPFKRKKKELAAEQGTAACDRLSFFVVDRCFPHFVWVSEIAPLTLYCQGLCCGEIVWDASASPSEARSIYARLGRTMFTPEEKSTAPPSRALTHYPQYTHNLGET